MLSLHSLRNAFRHSIRLTRDKLRVPSSFFSDVNPCHPDAVVVRGRWGTQMKNYSIVRVGNEYVVQADEKSVLKTASRRRAARTVTDATELLDSQQKPKAPVEPSIIRDQDIVIDPRDHT
jgi:hypothetical protein